MEWVSGVSLRGIGEPPPAVPGRDDETPLVLCTARTGAWFAVSMCVGVREPLDGLTTLDAPCFFFSPRLSAGGAPPPAHATSFGL